MHQDRGGKFRPGVRRKNCRRRRLVFWPKRDLLPDMSKANEAKEKTARRILLLAAVLGGAGVALGAFGAHGLQKLELPPKGLEWWGTAVDYLFVHALALFGLAAWMLAGGRGAFFGQPVRHDAGRAARLGRGGADWWHGFYCRLDFPRSGGVPQRRKGRMMRRKNGLRFPLGFHVLRYGAITGWTGC